MTLEYIHTDTPQAIAFANAEFAKGLVFWPRLLVRCLEAKRQGTTIEVAIRLYKSRSDEKGDYNCKGWCDELHNVLSNTQINCVAHLRARGREIWYDTRCHSLLCRGITRLFGAAANMMACDYKEYEIEITRAIAMLPLRDDDTMDVDEFAVIVKSFEKKLSN